MKKSLEIVASFTGKISTGAYENMQPFYSLKEIIQIEDGEQFTDEEMIARQKQLHGYCYKQFQAQEESAKIERIQREYQNIRFYDCGEKKYPSVTSIIGWDKDFHISQDELNQHAARGTIIDKQIQVFLTSGEWKEPKDIPEIYPELVIVKKGTLGLEIDNVDFPAFYAKYPFRFISQQTTVINNEQKYAGTMEIKCIIESSNKGGWDKVEGCLFDVPTLLDVKATTSLDKTYVMKQNTAYAKCDAEIKQIGAIHLKKDNQCGYAKPVLEQDLNRYWSLFLNDRELFRRRYSV